MANKTTCWKLAVQMLFICGAAISSVGAPIDKTLLTTYEFSPSGTNITWSVCGSTQQTQGCYGTGSLGPFGKLGALLEGDATINLNTVTRYIYVVDIDAPEGIAILYVYKKTDVITPSNDTVNVNLFATIPLSFAADSTASCFMAANKRFLFIGTDKGTQAVRVTKKDLGTTLVADPLPVTSITADKYGYVTVTQPDTNVGPGRFSVFAPNGTVLLFGGGQPFMLNPIDAVLPSTLPH